MNTTTSTSPNRGINEIMSETTIQNFIVKNKVAVIIGFVFLVVLVVGIGFYASMADQSKSVFNSKIYAFETTLLKGYEQSPTSTNPKAIKDALLSLHAEMGNYVGLFPAVIKTSDLLMTNNHLAEAKDVLEMGLKVAHDSYAQYFVLSRLAVAYEDLGQDKMAIETLEKMNKSGAKIFEGKNYLDLGRLYLKSGDKEKAKASFKYVVEKAKDEAEFVKIAELYLSGL